MKKPVTIEDLHKRLNRVKGRLFYSIGVIEEINLLLYKLEQKEKT
jgi:hypothetical protein